MNYNSFVAKVINKIYDDTKEREEAIVDEINFFGAIFKLKVKDKNGKIKSVTYSAAENVLPGYRKLSLQ